MQSDVMTVSFTAPSFEVNDPWSTTPRGLDPLDLSTILSGIPLPRIYTTAFDLAQPVGGKITVSALTKILSVSGLPPVTVDKILNIVVAPTRSRITKGECSVTLALVAMAQKNMDLTIENLTTHREDLPVPHLPGLESLDFGNVNEPDIFSTSPIPRQHHPVNVENSAASVDPWRNSTYISSTTSTSLSNYGSKGSGGYPPAPSYLASPPLAPRELAPQNGTSDPESTRKEMYQWFLNLDTIRMSFAPEKEGIFLFKHTNYIVESKNRQTTVIRRYSDFWWLLEVLSKRFPFRTLPNLPPKRLGVTDEVFLARRLRGLTRFMNALVRHPVLKNDPLVVSFLTEPVELALWRKNVVISTEDEFTTRLPISDALAKQIPMTLELELESIKKRLPASIEYYRNMVNVLDRVQKRTEANAADYTRFSISLNALADCERKCHIEDCYNCGQLSQGYSKVSSHFNQASGLLEEEARETQRGMVEALKRHRDLLISVQELLQRRDQSREGNVAEMLKKRIASNEAKLNTLKTSAANAAAAAASNSGSGSRDSIGLYDAQIEKVKNNIESDQTELQVQNQRSILMQHTLWMEITYYHKSHAQIAGMYQAFVHGQMKTSQSLFDNWKALSPAVHDLPMEVNGFN
ncbi:Sorting nexin mvp1 [Entomortierella chlamydospora]|uniref:Sorting nexin MVP1 n=1 Tax=Entomortierella chlamydospora TaxID=101097 RepID=A0A9P6SWN9_9FUNG|nr:Sorting nexin mvp1 [Entomortierella chlamydospora]KAG0008700.1 Sorting nexin mvp1 [Entomortierella chlamydospora]